MKKGPSPIVKSVLKEELERVRSLQRRYEQKLKEYPAGYLLKRNSGSKIYYYLSYREEDRIRQKYLGSLSSDELKKYQRQMEEKKVVRDQMAQVKNNIRYLERLLRK